MKKIKNRCEKKWVKDYFGFQKIWILKIVSHKNVGPQLVLSAEKLVVQKNFVPRKKLIHRITKAQKFLDQISILVQEGPSPNSNVIVAPCKVGHYVNNNVTLHLDKCLLGYLASPDKYLPAHTAVWPDNCPLTNVRASVMVFMGDNNGIRCDGTNNTDSIVGQLWVIIIFGRD